MDKIESLLEVSTTPNDIYRIAGKICNIFTYPEIVKFKNISQLFRKGNSQIAKDAVKKLKLPYDDNCCIILYMTGPEYGHWTILIRNLYGINFLDSYGDVVDDQFKYIDRDIPGQGNKHLVDLLIKYPGDVYYNDVKMQAMSDNINTCGRYCALYLRYDYMLVDDFTKKLKKLASENSMTCDQIVCLLSLDSV